MPDKRVVTGITITADSVVVNGHDFDWLCSMARDMEKFGTLLGLKPDLAQLCHAGHEPIIHFSECPICSVEQQSAGPTG